MKQHIIRPPNTVQGHVMLDKIKLKNGLAWNYMNNEVTGFISDEMNTSEFFENILGLTLDKIKNKKQIAVYATKWRFRSTKNKVHNAKFYYNTGSLDSNEITKQFFDVLTSYEMLGMKILGIMIDGGGRTKNSSGK